MSVREDFLDFLDHHPRMSKDKPAPKLLYANLLEPDSAMDINIKSLNIPAYTSGYRCTDVDLWKNIIKPKYERKFHKDYGTNPMVPGTYWNHLAAINKYIEFLSQYKPLL